MPASHPPAPPDTLQSALEMRVLRAEATPARVVGNFGPPSGGGGDLALAIPDLAFQIGVPLPEDARHAVHRAVFDRLGPGIDLRVGTYHGRENVGVWLAAPSNDFVDAAREAGIAQLGVAADHLFGFYLSSDLMQTLAASAWEAQAKVLRDDGRPVQRGPIHLEALAVELAAPNRVITKVTARSDESWPSTRFAVTVVDVLTATGAITAASVATSDRGPEYIAKIGAAASLPSLIGSLAGRLSPPAILHGGAGSALANLLPGQFLTETAKYVLYYEEVRVGPIGAAFRGTPVPAPRLPRVGIQGRDRLAVLPGTGRVSSTYGIWINDLHPDGLRVTWSCEGTVQDRSGVTTEVTFDLPVHGPDHPTRRHVRAEARDRDGFVAEAELVVTIHTLDGRTA